jgi:hypothetical protein
MRCPTRIGQRPWPHESDVIALSPQGDFAYLQIARASLRRGHAIEARRFLDQIIDTRHNGLKLKPQALADQLSTVSFGGSAWWNLQPGFLPPFVDRSVYIRRVSIRLHLDRIEIDRNRIAVNHY